MFYNYMFSLKKKKLSCSPLCLAYITHPHYREAAGSVHHAHLLLGTIWGTIKIINSVPAKTSTASSVTRGQKHWRQRGWYRFHGTPAVNPPKRMKLEF